MIRILQLPRTLLPAVTLACLACTACNSKAPAPSGSGREASLVIGPSGADDEASAPSDPPPAEQAAAESSSNPAHGGLVLTQDQVEGQYTPAFNTCMESGDAAQGITVAMADCIGAELQVQDQRLNAAYRSAMEKRDEAGRAALRQEERAWIKARDAKCAALRQGGTIDAIQIPSCILDETIRRRVRLMPMAG